MTSHPRARTQRPLGQPTRGKTAHNRLRRVDNFLLYYDSGLLRRRDGAFADACFVDLGYGAEPWTTLESAARLRRVAPALPVLGVEIDPVRVAAAQPYADALTQFRLGGFNVPLHWRPDGTREAARALRAFNVLRQYEEDEVAAAWEAMGQALLPGGLLLEGTSEPFGRLWVANLLRKEAEALRMEGLVFSTNFRLGFDPAAFQAVLPKNYIHRMVEGEMIYALLEAWKRAVRETMAVRAWGLRQWFSASAHRLAELGQPVVLRPRLLAGGYLLLRIRE